jgi:hypothetical protein
MTKNDSPLETIEQIAVVQWCELQGLKFTAIPNSTYSPHMSVKMRNHREGVRAGFPDMVVLIPPKQSKDGLGYMLCVEMKRVTGGILSQVQKDWAIALNGLESPNIEAVVARGADEAIEYISSFLKKIVEYNI